MGRKVLFFVVMYAPLVIGVGYFVAALNHLADPGQLVNGLAYVMVVLALLWVVALVLLLVDTVSEFRSRDLPALRRSMQVMKFGMIPFFVLNWVFLVLFTTAFVGATRGLGLIMAWVPVLWTYAVFIPTSFYGWAYLMHLFRERRLGAGWFVGHVLAQGMFVIDVVSTIVLVTRTKGVVIDRSMPSGVVPPVGSPVGGPFVPAGYPGGQVPQQNAGGAPFQPASAGLAAYPPPSAPYPPPSAGSAPVTPNAGWPPPGSGMQVPPAPNQPGGHGQV